MEKNKIIGLRAFATIEKDFFYGRKKEIESLIKILQKDKLVTLIGPSGSGKSSLLNAGLIPRLKKGFLAQSGKEWAICSLRPGISPIKNLAYSLTAQGSLSIDSKANTEDFKIHLNTLKKYGNLGLAEIYKNSSIYNKKNLLIVIDQLEDLFSFNSLLDPLLSDLDDILLNLVARTSRIKDTSIYFVLAIQSEYFSNLTQYAKLQEIISKSQYAIPNFSNEGLSEFIKSHFIENGISFSAEAQDLIETELFQDSSLLPNMQLLFKELIKNNIPNDGKIIEVNQINSLGGLNYSIKKVYEKTYNQLSDIQKEGFKKIIKSLHKFQLEENGNYETIQNVSKITELSIQEISNIINIFKDSLGDSYEIIPKSITGIDKNRILLLDADDILSNKYNFQRNWELEQQWIKEEKESFKSYKIFADLADKFQAGKASLLNTPELDLAQEWIKNKDHNLSWSKQYEFNYKKTTDYIEESIKVHKQNREREENRLKRKKKITRQIGAVMGLLVLIAGGFAYFSKIAERDAEKAKLDATVALEQAKIAEEDAKNQKEIAIGLSEEANRQRLVADFAREDAIQNAAVAFNALKLAKKNADEAKKQADKAQQQKKTADIAKEEADKKTIEANNAKNESENRRRIAVIESEFYPIIRKLERLVEYENGSDPTYKNEIVNAISETLEKFDEYSSIQKSIYGKTEDTEGTYMILQTALRVLEGKKNYNNTSMLLHKIEKESAIRSIDSYNNSVLAFGGDNGILNILNVLNKNISKIPIKERIRKVVFINPNNIIVGTFEGNVYRVDLTKTFTKSQESRIVRSKSPIIDIFFNEKTNFLNIFSEKEVFSENIYKNNFSPKAVKFKIKGTATIDDKLFIGSDKNIFLYENEKLIQIELKIDDFQKENISTFLFSNDFLFLGTNSGKIAVFLNPKNWNNLSPLKHVQTIPFHRSGITKLYFDEDTNQLYSSSFDNQILKYKIDQSNIEESVREFISLIGHEKWVWDMSLIKNSESKEVIVTVDENGNVLTWFKNQEDLALKVKSILLDKYK